MILCRLMGVALGICLSAAVANALTNEQLQVLTAAVTEMCETPTLAGERFKIEGTASGGAVLRAVGANLEASLSKETWEGIEQIRETQPDRLKCVTGVLAILAPAMEPTLPDQLCDMELIAPKVNSTFDQGPRLSDDRVEPKLRFIWRNCPEAERYHLYVIGPDAINPIIDNNNITSAVYLHSMRHYGVTHLEGWTWRVRAYVDGRWENWSETRTFNFAPAPPRDTD